MRPPSTPLQLAAFTALVAAAPAAAAPSPRITVFDSPAEALAALLDAKPEVIAFGEYHEIEGATPGVKPRSALAHFTDELLPMVTPPVASDLVLETWVTDRACGKQEEKVVKQVEETTKRPESTEDELVTLVKKARKVGVSPHILTLTCEEYAALLDEKGEVDYVKLLAKITELLRKKILAVLHDPDGAPTTGVLVYGGALHNDVYPVRELAPFSFAAALKRATKNRYLEVDLYVPEFIAADERITAERWYRLLARRKVAPDKTVLVRRGPGSFIILFPRTPPAASPAPAASPGARPAGPAAPPARTGGGAPSSARPDGGLAAAPPPDAGVAAGPRRDVAR